MIPQNCLSSETLQSPFLGGRSLPVRAETDYESGGYAIQDSSRGLLCNIWRTRIINNKTQIVIDARPADEFGQIVPEAVLISGSEITEVSTSFDRNMRPVVAYVDSGVPKLYWYDTAIPGQTTTDFPGIISPRVSHDDKREMQSAISDVIFTYLRVESGEVRLFYRQQRDRYTVEYEPAQELYDDLVSQGWSPSSAQVVLDDYRAQVAVSPGIIKCGMMRNLRFGWLFRNPT